MKLAKAASRHQQILEEKKAKAQYSAKKKDYGPKKITNFQNKQEAAEARRQAIL